MKYFYTFFVVVLFPLMAIAQNNWDVVWTMDQKPFLDPQIESEIAIVKAGFDTDQDGWGEFLCAWTDKEFNYILMYEASADNTYDLVWYWEYPVPSNTFAGIAVGDFDNNGKPEIVTTVPSIVDNDSPKRLWVFEWNGVQGENKYGRGEELGSITATNSWNFDLPNGIDFRPYGLTIEDIDNDGKNELIVGVRQGDRGREIVVVRATGNLAAFGTFETEFSFKENLNGGLYNVTTGDLDNDGNKEIYALIWDQMTIRFFETTGENQYELVTSLDQVTSGADYGALDGIRVTDVNNDGVNEMYIVGTEPDNTIFMVTNISDVSQITASDIVPFYKIPQQADGKLRSMQVADPDGDGNLDLMIAGEMNGQIFDLEYKGSGDPADSSNWELTTIFDIFEYAPDTVGTLTPRLFYGSPAGDMDNDGKQEYLFVNYRTSFSAWANDKYLWMIEIDQVTDVETSEETIPNKIELMQNFPNPFNPTTNIGFNLSESGFVTLTIFDVLGKKVKTLVDEQMNTGTHKVDFNASNLSAGTYFYELKVNSSANPNGFVQTKKLLLLK